MPPVRVWRCGSKSPAGSAHVRHGVARGVAGELEPRKLLHRIAAPGTYCHCGRVGGRPFEDDCWQVCAVVLGAHHGRLEAVGPGGRDDIRRRRIQSNNGMHPTANSVDFIRKLIAVGVACAAGDAGRWADACEGQ